VCGGIRQSLLSPPPRRPFTLAPLFGCGLSPFELADEVVPDRLELIERGDTGNRVLSSDASCRS
jgi:hypothetical protein